MNSSLDSRIHYNLDNYSNSCININDYLSDQTFDWTSLLGVRLLTGVIYSLIFCAGIFGNASVIIKVARNRKLQSARNIFLLSLMASDFLLCLTAVPFTPMSVITKRWIFGHFICRLLPLCQSMSVIITSLSLTAIAIDKYIHIMDVTKAPVTTTQSSIVVGVIWIIACVSNLPLVLSYDVFDGHVYKDEYGVTFCGEFCDEIHWPSQEYKIAYGTCITCVQFIIPMIIIIFCYSRIMRKVRADMMIDNKKFSSSLSAIQRLGAIRKKRKVNYILIMMVLAFVGAWLPLTLFNILRDYNMVPDFVKSQPFLWALIVHSMAMTTVIWNPLLFFWLTRRKIRNGGPLEESIVFNFLLTSNPIRLILKYRNKQEVAYQDDSNTCEPTCTDHECSYVTTSPSPNSVKCRKEKWFKMSLSKRISIDSSNIHHQLVPSTISKRKHNLAHQMIVYQNKYAKPVSTLGKINYA